jgi:HlyD family secretion protein
VWVLDGAGRPRAVNVRTGLTDGTYTQLVGGDLQEGAQVIVGTQSGAKALPQTKGGPRFGF